MHQSVYMTSGGQVGGSLCIEVVLAHELSERAQTLFKLGRSHDWGTSGGESGVGETVC